jgi:hypothetical protein
MLFLSFSLVSAFVRTLLSLSKSAVDTTSCGVFVTCATSEFDSIDNKLAPCLGKLLFSHLCLFIIVLFSTEVLVRQILNLMQVVNLFCKIKQRLTLLKGYRHRLCQHLRFLRCCGASDLCGCPAHRQSNKQSNVPCCFFQFLVLNAQWFGRSSIEMARSVSACKAPVVARIMEEEQAVLSIRSFAVQSLWRQDISKRAWTLASVNLCAQACNRWLNLRLSVLGGVGVWALAFAALTGASVNKGYIALGVAASLDLRQIFNMTIQNWVNVEGAMQACEQVSLFHIFFHVSFTSLSHFFLITFTLSHPLSLFFVFLSHLFHSLSYLVSHVFFASYFFLSFSLAGASARIHSRAGGLLCGRCSSSRSRVSFFRARVGVLSSWTAQSTRRRVLCRLAW